MIKRELTIQEQFQRWRSLSPDDYLSYSDKLFNLIAASNLTQMDALELAFPDHVRIFKDFFSESKK